jgi:hypothetical protein
MKAIRLISHMSILIAGLMLINIASAQESQDNSTLETPLPEAMRLEGFTQIYQDTNRCSAAALSTHLTFFDENTLGYRDVIAQLNPYGGDVSVRIEEMGALAETQGLGSIVRRGGTLDLLKQLIAAGFPVLIENVYYDGPNGWDDWLSHNRVLVGYDDNISTLYFFDPLLGNGDDGLGRPMTYDDVDTRWQPFNRDFLVIYQPEDEATLQAILGDTYWDAELNAQHTLDVAQAEIDAGQGGGFAYFNRGWAEVQLGMYEEAALSFDEGRRLGIPWRMYWYEFGIFEAYLQAERYDDVINLVFNVLQTTDGVEEVYYYIARAYVGKGEVDRAIANLEAALYRNRYFEEAKTLLQELVAGDSDENAG